MKKRKKNSGIVRKDKPKDELCEEKAYIIAKAASGRIVRVEAERYEEWEKAQNLPPEEREVPEEFMKKMLALLKNNFGFPNHIQKPDLEGPVFVLHFVI